MNIDQILDSLQDKGYDKQERAYQIPIIQQYQTIVSFEKNDTFIVKIDDDTIAILDDEDYGFVLSAEDFQNSTYNK